tara:strand:+ start:2285 stop:3319 length:1035 start_codon:yes stop_codon:yes gene_type:complete
MSRIRADRVTNREGTGAPLFPNGISVVGLTSLSNVVTGIVTASQLFGDGSNLTGVTATDVGTLSSLNVTGNVSIGGTLTYEDVTNIDSVGLITARSGINITSGSIKGYNQLVAPYSGTTTTLTVTVASKVNGEHRYFGTGSALGYVVDGTQSPYITLTPGRTYRFDQADASNANHPIKFYLNADKTGLYEGGVTYNGTAGNAGAYTQIIVNDYTPTVLHYQCVNHGYMGNAVNTSSNSSMSAESSTVTAMGANSVDCSLGNYFTKTITGATTFTFDNVPASGVAFGFVMELTLNGSNAVTWPGSVKWPKDTAPTITDGKTQMFVFVTDNGGTRWRGSSLVDYTN